MNLFLKQVKTRSRWIVLLGVLALIAIGLSFSTRNVQEDRGYGWVKEVSDGDTIVLSDGRKIRYLNIDCPERGEAFFKEARRHNQRLVQGKKVALHFCRERTKDRYGRWLAHVEVGEEHVGRSLLKSGMAFLYIIPPCGLALENAMASDQREARENKRGIWKKEEIFHVPVGKVSGMISKHVFTEGTVSGVFQNEKLAFLDIGEDGARYLRLVIYSNYFPYFEKKGHRRAGKLSRPACEGLGKD